MRKSHKTHDCENFDCIKKKTKLEENQARGFQLDQNPQLEEIHQKVQIPFKKLCVNCKSNNKIIRSIENIKQLHASKLKTFDTLRRDLLRQDHTLKNAQMTLNKEYLDVYVEEEIQKLTKSFQKAINDLKIILKSHISNNVQSFKDLFDLYDAVIDKNYTKIEELQYAIPMLQIQPDDIQKQQESAQGVLIDIDETLKEISDSIRTISQYIFNEFDRVSLKTKKVNFQWSNSLKHANAIISGNTLKDAFAHHMIILEPSLSMSEVTRVRIKIKKLEWVQLNFMKAMISLCDVNIAKNIRPTWDYRQNVGEGTYSHYNSGGIYPHHLAIDQKNGQVLAFSFQCGDILELEWNGPLRQFITSKPSTHERYVQNVQFDQDALLHFSVQLLISSVKIVQ